MAEAAAVETEEVVVEETAAEETASEETTTEEAASSPEPPVNWRDTIVDPELRKVAERFNSPTDAIKSVVDLRKRESTSIRLPGKNASDEERAAYRKAIGVPETTAGYVFDVPEGREATDADKAFQARFAEAFHSLDISAAQAKGLNALWNEMTAEAEKATVEADETYQKDVRARLEKEWADDFKRNWALGQRAAEAVFGADLEEIRHIEMKNGRYLLDHPLIVKAFASIGAEMDEGRIGPRLGEAERDSLTEKIDNLQAEKMRAYDRGDRDRALRLDAEQLALIAKRDGDAPIVGAGGRTT